MKQQQNYVKETGRETVWFEKNKPWLAYVQMCRILRNNVLGT